MTGIGRHLGNLNAVSQQAQDLVFIVFLDDLLDQLMQDGTRHVTGQPVQARQEMLALLLLFFFVVVVVVVHCGRSSSIVGQETHQARIAAPTARSLAPGTTPARRSSRRRSSREGLDEGYQRGIAAPSSRRSSAWLVAVAARTLRRRRGSRRGNAARTASHLQLASSFLIARCRSARLIRRKPRAAATATATTTAGETGETGTADRQGNPPHHHHGRAAHAGAAHGVYVMLTFRLG